MIDMIEKLSTAIGRLLPKELEEELKQNIAAVIRSNFEKMQLVTREQLEIQEKILRRTQQRLAQVEQKLAELEDKPKQ